MDCFLRILYAFTLVISVVEKGTGVFKENFSCVPRKVAMATEIVCLSHYVDYCNVRFCLQLVTFCAYVSYLFSQQEPCIDHTMHMHVVMCSQ